MTPSDDPIVIRAAKLSLLERAGLTRGVAALCIGGGEATAIAVELNPN